MGSRFDLRIPPAMPDEFAPMPMSTSESYVSTRNIVEFRPYNDTLVQLDSTTSNTVEFVLNSRDGFMDNAETFCEIDVSCNIIDKTVPVINEQMCTGGIHSWIKKITVYDESGTIIDECPEYATLYAAMSNLTHNKDYVESQGALWGDSVERELEMESGMRPYQLPGTYTVTAVIATSVITITGVSTHLNQQLAVGDLIVIYLGSAVDTTFLARVTAFDGTSPQLTMTAVGTVSVAIAAVGGYTIIKLGTIRKGCDNTTIENVDNISQRGYVARSRPLTSSLPTIFTKLQFKPMLGFLRMNKYVPLRYLRNMRIAIEFNPAWACVMGNYGSLTDTADKVYNIWYRNARWVATIIQPAEDVLQAWDERYQSEVGLVFNWTGVYCTIQPDTGSNTDVNQLIPSKLASAKGVLSVVKTAAQVQRTDGAWAPTTGVGASWAIDKCGMSTSANISSYYYKIGTERFPLRRNVNVDFSGLENLQHNLHCIGASGQNMSNRINPSDVRKIHPTTSETAKGQFFGSKNTSYLQSKRCYLTADFAKSGFLTGANLRDADLIFTFTRQSSLDANDPSCYFFHYIFYDKISRIQAGNSGILNYF